MLFQSVKYAGCDTFDAVNTRRNRLVIDLVIQVANLVKNGVVSIYS